MILQNQSRRTTVAGAAAVALTFVFLLLLSQGFVTSGDDWYFSARDTGEGLVAAFRAACHNAYRHYLSLNGRLLGNGSSRFFGTHDTLRELGRCAIMLVIILQLFRTCRLKKPLMYLLTVAFALALPADIYAQSYVWAAGFFNYVPPVMMILAYILRADRVMGGEKDTFRHGFFMFLLALPGQLFVENVTVGICLLSGAVMIWYLAANRRLSWSLCGYLLGAVVGCVIMFSAPGYSNVNQEGYRQVSTTFDELMKVIQTNFSVITLYLTERNWAVIAPLTGLGIVLLMQAGQKRPTLRFLAIAALLICPVWFYANRQLLKTLYYVQWVTDLSFWLDLGFNLCYLLAVLTAAVLGLKDENRRRRAILGITAVPMIFGPLVVVNPIGPRCMYIPYMLLVCILLIFAAEVLEQWGGKVRKVLCLPAALTVACVLTCYLWTAVWNGHCERVRIRQIEQAMSAGDASVELPSYPYTDYVHNGNGGAIRYYYYYETPCDLEFQYIYHPDWYRN